MLKSLRDVVVRNPTRMIIAVSSALRLSTCALLVASHRLLPTWDAEVTTLAHPIASSLEPFVRWDTVHFVHIALEGYQSDQQTAFLPGLPALMRLGGEAVHRVVAGRGDVSADEIVLVGIFASAIASTAAAIILYRCRTFRDSSCATWNRADKISVLRLTLRLFPKRGDFAATTALLFLLAPSRPTLHAVPYTEPFAALFTFLGMLLFLQNQDLAAAVSWACGSAFRAQGIILGVGFFGWKWILQRVWTDGPGFSVRHLRVR